MSIKCCECGSELEEIVDTTYANYTNHRVNNGDHTGDIYDCEKCDCRIIDDKLNGCLRVWAYE